MGHLNYRVEWSQEDGEYVATCVEMPSWSWLDPSPIAALAGLLDAIDRDRL